MCLQRGKGSTVIGFHCMSKTIMDLYLKEVVLFVSVDEKLNINSSNKVPEIQHLLLTEFEVYYL